MSIKTTKRLALGVIAALVFAPFAAIAPASAAVTAVAGFNIAATGNIATTNTAAAANEPEIFTRVGETITLNTITYTGTATAGATFKLVQIATADPTATVVSTPIAATAVTTTTASFTVTAAMNGGFFYIQADDNNDSTFEVKTDLGFKLNVVNATAPKSVTWAAAAVTEVVATAFDYTINVTPKDANGASTILLDGETISIDVAPVTGASATQVIVTDASKSEAEATTPGASTYAVNLDGAPAGATGATVPGVEYIITAQLVDGTSAIGAPVATKYKRLANTAGLTGTVVFTSDQAGTLPITSVTTSPNVATANFFAFVKDANGALVKGVTVAFTGGGVGTASINTDQTGLTSANTATPTVAGTGTVTATITTGTSSITGTLSVVATAGSTLEASNNNWSVAKNNGSGVLRTSTLPATNGWAAAPNTTSFAVTLTGLTANTAVKLTAGGNATTVKVNTITNGVIYPVANAAGSVTVTLTVASGTNTQTATLAADTGAFGGTDSTLTITFTSTAAALTTAPAASSLNMSTLSASQSISATIADQYGNPITGGSVVITNTSAPAGVTLATAATVMTDAAGKATVTATIGAVAGSYVFSVQAKDANNSNVGSASTITYQASATGIAGTLTLTDSDADALTATDDNKATRTVVIAPAALTNAVAAGTDNTVSFTVVTATPAGLAFTATATNGARLFTSTPQNAVITAGKSSVTGTAGTTTVFAVPTKVGDSVITVTAGGLTKVFTLTGKLNATPKAQLITLTPGTNTNGRAAYTVTTTDTFGNPVAANVDITVTGTGFFSSGFKGITVPTGAAGTNGFEILSPLGGANTLSATIASGSYLAITATEATTQTVTASVQTATATVTVAAAAAPEIVYDKPTLSFVKDGGRIILSGTAVDGEGDIIIYTKLVGTTAWKERAKTLEVAAPGDYNGSIKALKNNVVIRVKQEGTGLFSNQIIVLK